MRDTRPTAHNRQTNRWMVHLVRAQVSIRAYGMLTLPPGSEDRWPSRLIVGGTLLAGTSAVLCVTWLRKRL